ncbi:Pro-interleukin-16 Interleukin-16 [Collichthys lucidus]|uniref:Pro-interleukin-16 Interleukin-16 n=1 Tax=Collichthys lucidus TaxID=240159 RepID=A0A4U5V4E7_COLLU|nr:Pro-interleukin-16 Interleukin-16 [Collichthys lucidus]
MSQSDRRSFSVSLSDLCNFAGVDYESENDSDEWQPTGRRSASLSSEMSALSCVSVMPSEELDRLLEDVRSLGDNNLKDYDDVQVVVLHKEMGVGLGFSVAGGVDQNKPVTVHKVFHSGVAAQEGSIREGDQVLSINGTSLCGFVHWEALRVLRRAKARELGVVVLRRGGISSICKGGAQANNAGPTQTQQTVSGQRLCVCLEKNNRDLGFSLEGGLGSSLENRPITVQKIFQGGPVDKVCPGDEVLEIEGVSTMGMRRLEAWTLIRKLPPGPVEVVLRRHLKHPET